MKKLIFISATGVSLTYLNYKTKSSFKLDKNSLYLENDILSKSKSYEIVENIENEENKNQDKPAINEKNQKSLDSKIISSIFKKSSSHLIKNIKIYLQQEFYNNKITEYTNKNIEQNIFSIQTEEFDNMGFLERVKFYRTLGDYNREIKSNKSFIRRLIYKLQEEINNISDNKIKKNEQSLNKPISKSNNLQKHSNLLEDNIINEFIRTGEIYYNIIDRTSNDSNFFIINYLFEEQIHNILSLYSQLLALNYHREKHCIKSKGEIKRQEIDYLSKIDIESNEIKVLNKIQIEKLVTVASMLKRKFPNNQLIALDSNAVINNSIRNLIDKEKDLDRVNGEISFSDSTTSKCLNITTIPNVLDYMLVKADAEDFLSLNNTSIAQLNSQINNESNIDNKDLKRKKLNFIYINGLNSVPLKSWRLIHPNEIFFNKTKPSLFRSHINSIFNFIFNTDINSTPKCLKTNFLFNLHEINFISNKILDNNQQLRTNTKEIETNKSISDNSTIISKKANAYNHNKENSLSLKLKKIYSFRYYKYHKLWITSFFKKEMEEKYKSLQEDNSNINQTTNKNKFDEINHYIAKIETSIFTKHLNGLPNYTLEQIALNLKSSLENSRILDDENSTNIFIVHSMGGLILKEMIKQELDTSNIKGVVFFSSPHLGSSVFNDIAVALREKTYRFARIADNIFAESALPDEELKLYLNNFNTSKSCNQICWSSPSYFKDLHKTFTTKYIPHFCINETDKSYLYECNNYFYIVHPNSSNLIFNLDMYPEDYFEKIYKNRKNKAIDKTLNYLIEGKKHYNIQKFANNNDPAYKELLERIDSIMKF